MATRIKLRRDTLANWASVNPILALGEPGLETDTRKIKYGDGVTAWNSLQYAASEGGSSYSLPTASASTLGGIKIGTGLSIDGNGVVSASTATQYTLPTASDTTLGGIKIGTGLSIDGNGVVSNSVTTGNLIFSGDTITANNANFQLNSIGGNVILNPAGIVSVGTGSTSVVINGNSGLIQMPNNGQIYGASGALYSLRDVSTIYFSDGTTQTSASVTGNISNLVNGDQQVVLSSTGTTTFPGDIRLPQVDISVNYNNVEALSVNSNTVVIASGAYPIPQAGWLYNNIEIRQVSSLSGNYSLQLASTFNQPTGFYTLTSFPNSVPKGIIFSDGTRQTTAYTGTTGPVYVTATIDLSQIDQNILPATNDTYNLGSVSNAWRELHISSSTFYVGGVAVGVGGSPTTLTLDGQPISAELNTDVVWNSPDSTTWSVKTYSGNFAGTYQQDITGLTYNCAPANTATDSTFILINRNDYTQIDTVLATVDQLRIDGIPNEIVSIVYDTYPDGVRINLATPVTISSESVVVVEYRTLGTGPIKWFDFANTPDAGVGLIGGEIKFHTHVRLNDGLDGTGGDVVTMTFDTASGTFDQTKMSHGNASSSTFTVFDSSSTGISYKTNWGAGQYDQIKVQWVATLYYNGSWFAT